MSLVVLKSAELVGDFKYGLESAGIAYEEFAGLPRHFKVAASETELQPFSDWMLCIEAEDVPIHPAQDIAFDADLSAGSWALARIIRRRPPWSTKLITFPVETYFESVRDGTGVDIYIFDSGIRIAHDEFSGRASIVYEYVAASGSDGDSRGHGTAVASCAAGDTVGVARGATVFSIKITTTASGGTASNTSLIAGISAALTHYSGRSGLDTPAVANISYSFANVGVSSAIADMIDAGIVVCGSAGNSAASLSTVDAFPAEFAEVVGVAGLGILDIPYATTSGTNYGDNITVSAPGQNIKIADFIGNSAYRLGSGTSYSSPLAAGVIACMLEGHGRLTTRAEVLAVREKLVKNATRGRITFPPSGHVPDGGLPNRILYLDPAQTPPEPIPGL